MIVARDLDGEIAEGGRNAPSAFETRRRRATKAAA